MLSAASRARSHTQSSSQPQNQPGGAAALEHAWAPIVAAAPPVSARRGNGAFATGFDRSPAATGPSRSSRPLRSGGHEGRRDALIDALRAQASAYRTLVAIPGVAPVRQQLQRDLDETRERLLTQQALDFMTDTVHALGAPATLVRKLDAQLRVKVVDSTGAGSDAEYDPASRTIAVSRDLVDAVAQQQRRLQQQGVVDAEGNVLRPQALDSSPLADAVVKTAALIGAHEATHAEQHRRGLLDRIDARLDAMEDQAARALQALPAATADDYAAHAARWIERQRIFAQELPAYRNQERLQRDLGASTRTQLTLSEHGTVVPAAEAVENIARFTADDDAHERRERPRGRRMPGRRMPGDEVEGRRMPGRRMPGSTVQ